MNKKVILIERGYTCCVLPEGAGPFTSRIPVLVVAATGTGVGTRAGVGSSGTVAPPLGVVGSSMPTFGETKMGTAGFLWPTS